MDCTSVLAEQNALVALLPIAESNGVLAVAQSDGVMTNAPVDPIPSVEGNVVVELSQSDGVMTNAPVDQFPSPERNNAAEGAERDRSQWALANCLRIVRSSQPGSLILGSDLTEHLIAADLLILHNEMLNLINLEWKGQWHSNGSYDNSVGTVYRGKCPHFGVASMANITNKRKSWTVKMGCTRMYSLSAQGGLQFVNDHCVECSKLPDVSMDKFKRSLRYIKCNIISKEASTIGKFDEFGTIL